MLRNLLLKRAFGTRFEFSFSGIEFPANATFRNSFPRHMVFKVFDRRIEFSEIFCTFSKILLAEDGGLASFGRGSTVEGNRQ